MQSKTFYKGISISSCQGNIQFPQIAATGIEIVYIRTGVGNNYTDPYFEKNYQAAKRAGLLVGLFHDTVARTPQEAESEARFFTSLAGGLKFDCHLAMSYEYFRGLGLANINNIALSFLQTTAKLSQREVMLYTDTYNATLTFEEEITPYPLWVAQYGVSTPSSKIRWKNWAGFEHTDSAGVPGIAGRNRLSLFRPNVLLKNNSPLPQRETERFYTVQSGETLWWVARQTCVNIEQLVELNHLQVLHTLREGAILKLPADICKQAQAYTVKEGDTLANIANRIHTTVARLITINKIKLPYLIRRGQILYY